VLILAQQPMHLWEKCAIKLGKAPFYGWQPLFPVPNILLYPYNLGLAMRQEPWLLYLDEMYFDCFRCVHSTNTAALNYQLIPK
jgi:hypothetical protein